MNQLSEIKLEDWQYGLLVGMLPTGAMLGSSFLLMNLEVSSLVEACFQNFCAGLIISACGTELFPLITVDSSSKYDIFCGISIGFSLGLALLYGIEHLIDIILDVIEAFSKSSTNLEKEGYSNIPDLEDWEQTAVQASAEAINIPDNRTSIKSLMLGIESAVSELQQKTCLIQQSESKEESDDLAEGIDEDIHKLQYKVDKARRYLEGGGNNRNDAPPVGYISLPENKRDEIRVHLDELSGSINHIIEHIATNEAIDPVTLKEIHMHLEELDKQISGLHYKVESATRTWRKSRPLLETVLGEVIPLKLVIPVAIDGAIDGFLIGITCALTRKGGLILGFANCLEMAFLGMAFTTRVAKCTGSSRILRNLTIVAPPLIMLAATALGAYFGDVGRVYPIAFISFVSFGIVALLSLVCGELIIDARAAQGEAEQWWVSVMIFIGIYVVLMLGLIVPE